MGQERKFLVDAILIRKSAFSRLRPLEPVGPITAGVQFGPQSTRIRFSVHTLDAARQPTIDWHSAMVRKQLGRIAEAAHWIFADAFEIEIALDEVGEPAGQQHLSTNCLVRVSP